MKWVWSLASQASTYIGTLVFLGFLWTPLLPTSAKPFGSKQVSKALEWELTLSEEEQGCAAVRYRSQQHRWHLAFPWVIWWGHVPLVHHLCISMCTTSGTFTLYFTNRESFACTTFLKAACSNGMLNSPEIEVIEEILCHVYSPSQLVWTASL